MADVLPAGHALVRQLTPGLLGLVEADAHSILHAGNLPEPDVGIQKRPQVLYGAWRTRSYEAPSFNNTEPEQLIVMHYDKQMLAVSLGVLCHVRF